MLRSRHYRIDYIVLGNYKTFYLCAELMSDAEAWHWAAIDAGFGQIPKYRNDKAPKISKCFAEINGISEVAWSPA